MTLARLSIAGSPRDIGTRLGRWGADAVHRHLVHTASWRDVMARGQRPEAAAMRAQIQARFPAIWHELEGLAAGLGRPLDEVVLWHCRGDLGALGPDQCTTIQMRGAGGANWVAHNEDGDPGLAGACGIADIAPDGAPAFTSFVYPGSLPGHTFAVNQAGLVQAVNNLRCRDGGAGVPRMVLGRAVLSLAALDQAVALLQGADRAGGFHFTLGCRGDERLLGIEFSARRCSVIEIAGIQAHANHMIHPETRADPQLVTESSAARQHRADALCRTLPAAAVDTRRLHGLLADRADAALPIYRQDPADPDGENTHATAVFRIGATAVEWAVFDRPEGPPLHRSAETAAPA